LQETEKTLSAARIAANMPISSSQDVESLEQENRRLKVMLRQNKEQSLHMRSRVQRLESELKKRDKQIEVLLTSKKHANRSPVPLSLEVRKIRRQQERCTTIKSLQNELAMLRCKTKSSDQQTCKKLAEPTPSALAELTRQRDEYLAEAVRLRSALEYHTLELQKVDGSQTRSMVTSHVTEPLDTPSMTEAIQQAKDSPLSISTTSVDTHALAPSTAGRDACVDTYNTRDTSPSEVDEGDAVPPHTSINDGNVAEPTFHQTLQPNRFSPTPVRPQRIFRDSIASSKPPVAEGTKLGSISETKEGIEEEMAESDGESNEADEEHEKEEGNQIEQGGTVNRDEEGASSFAPGKEDEEAAACLSSCSAYLSQLSLPNVESSTSQESRNPQHRNAEDNSLGMMATISLGEDVEEAWREEKQGEL
jgi:hypothetical protein